LIFSFGKKHLFIKCFLYLFFYCKYIFTTSVTDNCPSLIVHLILYTICLHINSSFFLFLFFSFFAIFILSKKVNCKFVLNGCLHINKNKITGSIYQQPNLADFRKHFLDTGVRSINHNASYKLITLIQKHNNCRTDNTSGITRNCQNTISDTVRMRDSCVRYLDKV